MFCWVWSLFFFGLLGAFCVLWIGQQVRFLFSFLVEGDLRVLVRCSLRGSHVVLVVFACAGHTVQFCRDQHGSRFIQQKLEVSSEEDKEVFFDEILPHTQRWVWGVGSKRTDSIIIIELPVFILCLYFLSILSCFPPLVSYTS